MNNASSRSPWWVWLVAVLTPVLGFALASIPPYHMLDHLGAEYDSIARAIYSGRGFADPFEIQTGPTAWMPPVLPTVLACGYWVTGGDRDAVMMMFVVGQAFAVGVTIFMVLAESVRLGRVGWGFLILVIGILVNGETLFRVTHDHSPLMVLVWALFAIMVRCRVADSDRIGMPIRCGIFGGFAALLSPVIAAVWAIWTAIQWRHSRRSVAIAALVSILVITPWTIRNRMVLGRWVPIKSAGKFEFWQSMCLDNDGLMDMDVMQQHPWGKDNEARRRYAELGEIAFIDSFDEATLEKLRGEPADCLKRVRHRLVSATMIWQPLAPIQMPNWIWDFRRMTFAAPFASVLVLLLTRRRRRFSSAELAAIWIYAGVLLPYILVSYYERYAAPLIGIKMLLVLYAIHRIVPQDDDRIFDISDARPLKSGTSNQLD